MPDQLILNGKDLPDTYGIVLIDIYGAEFRLRFDKRNGGIVINKVSDIDVSTITINPVVTNEIRVK